MAIPFVIFILMFSYYPLFGWIYAFFDYKPGLSVFSQDFTGLKQFYKLFSAGSDFIIAFRNTLVYGLLSIVTSPVPLIFALLLSEVRSIKFSRTIQTLTSFPNFISWVLVYSVFFSFFSNEGYINTLLLNLKIIDEPSSILANPNAAYLFQTLVGLWKYAGWGAIIYIAAITGINRELYDSAEVDGASRLGKVIHITIPGILPTFLVLLVLNISGFINAGFEQFYVFYNPLVSDKLEVIATYVYRLGLGQGEYSFATAVGIFQSLVSIILLFTVNQLAKRISGSSVI